MFYTYLWLREDGTPYYAGKGSGRRGFISGKHGGLHRPKDGLRIILQEHLSEADAFEAEKFLISYYGRLDTKTGCLRNLTDGGEGGSGNIPSESHKERVRIALLGKKHSDERRAHQSAAHKGKKRSETARKNLSETLKKLWASGRFATRKKPKPHATSEETKQKIRETMERRWQEGVYANRAHPRKI
jgi:hypothetical protein